MEEVKEQKLNLQMFTGKVHSVTPIHNFFCNLFFASVTITFCVSTIQPCILNTIAMKIKITIAIELTITKNPLPAPPNQKKGHPQK